MALMMSSCLFPSKGSRPRSLDSILRSKPEQKIEDDAERPHVGFGCVALLGDHFGR